MPITPANRLPAVRTQFTDSSALQESMRLFQPLLDKKNHLKRLEKRLSKFDSCLYFNEFDTAIICRCRECLDDSAQVSQEHILDRQKNLQTPAMNAALIFIKIYIICIIRINNNPKASQRNPSIAGLNDEFTTLSYSVGYVIQGKIIWIRSK